MYSVCCSLFNSTCYYVYYYYIKTKNSKCSMYGCVMQKAENCRKKIVYGRFSTTHKHKRIHKHILIRAKAGFSEWKIHGPNIAYTISKKRNERATNSECILISVYFIHDPFCFSRQFVRHPLITR